VQKRIAPTSRSHGAEPHLSAVEPVPIRRADRARLHREPQQQIVHDVRASLRATDVYVRFLIDRLELALTSDLVHLDGVPDEALVRLLAASDAFRDGAGRTLAHISPDLAQSARTIASLAEQGAGAKR
jgi:hypothetical protein